jgi:hypothetical protein
MKKPLAQSAEGRHVIQTSDHVLHDYENSTHLITVDYRTRDVKRCARNKDKKRYDVWLGWVRGRAGRPSMDSALRVA